MRYNLGAGLGTKSQFMVLGESKKPVFTNKSFESDCIEFFPFIYIFMSSYVHTKTDEENALKLLDQIEIDFNEEIFEHESRAKDFRFSLYDDLGYRKAT